MVFKRVESAEKRWQRLHGSDLMAEIITDVKFIDGIKQVEENSRNVE